MVKIERRETDKTRLAVESLVKEKSKAHGKYNTSEVTKALQEIFYGKCYICESKQSISEEIDHLIPHEGNLDLKFDWNNLFLACAHCNRIKGNTYTPILDCTKTDVDDIISFRKMGYFGTDESLSFDSVDDTDTRQETIMTCKLLQRVYYGKTTKEKFGAKKLRKDVRIELSKFKNYVREYRGATGEDKKDLFSLICKELKNNSPFTAFKRWIVRDNLDWCSDFMNCWKS